MAEPAPPTLTPLWALNAITFFSFGAQTSLFGFLAVFYHELGLSNLQIGMLQTLLPWTTLVGSLVWAWACDATGDYKKILVVSNIVGAVAICSLLLPAHQNFPTICVAVFVCSINLASVTLIDSFTLKVIEEYKSQEDAGKDAPQSSYGQQRLWGSAGSGFFALLSGSLMDLLGTSMMFLTFALCLTAQNVLISTQLPAQEAGTTTRPRTLSEEERLASRGLCSFEMFWFFCNLFVYGVHMALVETFLLVYLASDFTGVSKQLLGSSVTMMCLFEIPMFFYMQTLIDRYPIPLLLSFCHVVFALRVFCYSILPRDMPYLVLLVEPMHALTMAVFWACSVEFGSRLAPDNAKARMQALVSGIYNNAAFGTGSIVWGYLTQSPPHGFGFRAMYRCASVTMLLWCTFWTTGSQLYRRTCSSEKLGYLDELQARRTSLKGSEDVNL